MVVVVVIGAGSMGQAIARRVGAGKHTIVADVRSEVGVAKLATPRAREP